MQWPLQHWLADEQLVPSPKQLGPASGPVATAQAPLAQLLLQHWLADEQVVPSL